MIPVWSKTGYVMLRVTYIISSGLIVNIMLIVYYTIHTGLSIIDVASGLDSMVAWYGTLKKAVLIAQGMEWT